MKRITFKKSNKTKSKKNIKLLIIFLLMILVIAVILIRNFPTIRSIDIIIEDSTSEEKDESFTITKEQVLSLSNLKIGDRLYQYLRSDIEQRIEKNPYIKSAKIERELSGKVTIKISQRKPAYMINYAGEYIYIDEEGYILEVNSNSKDIPIIIGFTTDFSELSMGKNKIRINQNDLDKLEVVNRIINTLKNNNVENTINLLDVTNSQNFILHLDEDGKEVHIGDGSDITTKVLYIKKIIESEVGHTGIIYINGNLDEGYVYFKEQ